MLHYLIIEILATRKHLLGNQSLTVPGINAVEHYNITIILMYNHNIICLQINNAVIMLE